VPRIDRNQRREHTHDASEGRAARSQNQAGTREARRAILKVPSVSWVLAGDTMRVQSSRALDRTEWGQFVWRVALAMVPVLVMFGCGYSGEPATTPQTAGPSMTPTRSSSLVGEWQRVNKCEELVQALNQAGLKKAIPEMVAGSELVPGVVNDPDQLADKSHPCKGAVPRIHSHFFTESGQFGSRNHKREQVDEGPYRVVDDNTVLIGDPGVTFHYKITNDDTLMLDPVLPDCASHGCFEAGWSVSVAYPGRTWKRIS